MPYTTIANGTTGKQKVCSNEEGTSIVANLEGLDQLHTGFEVEVAYQPMPLLRVDAALGIGNWTYTDDVKASYDDWDSGVKQEEKQLYISKICMLVIHHRHKWSLA